MNAVKQIFWVLFYPLAGVWAGAYYLRRKFHKRPYVSGLTVISVGNVHVGGSGKTPLVLSLANAFKDAAIFSRGYRGEKIATGSLVDLTSDNGAKLYGDEPWMMAHLTSTPVYVGKNRSANLARARAAGIKVAILDDGFQHLAVARNLDIVAINVDYALDDNYCLPLGNLRESFSALHACRLVVLVCGDEPAKVDRWREWLATFYPSLPVVEARRNFVGFYNGQEKISPPDRVAAFCGLAKADSFRADVEKGGGVFLKAFPDHHDYSERDVDWIVREGQNSNCETFLTTDKDWYKVHPKFEKRGRRLLSRRMELVLPPEFWDRLKREIAL